MLQRENSWRVRISYLSGSSPLLLFLNMIKLKLEAGIRLQVINSHLIRMSTNIQNQFHGGKKKGFSYTTEYHTAALSRTTFMCVVLTNDSRLYVAWHMGIGK